MESKRVLLLENIHVKAKELFERNNFEVETYSGSLSEAELCEIMKGVIMLGVRSKTKITQKVIDAADGLAAIGAYCIGTDQTDLRYCSKKGIAVFNAPFSNTRSVVELAIGEIVMLVRGIFDKSSQMHKGVWNKSAKDSHEVRGKKIGILGYGKIGSQLSVLAEAMGMQVYYYDVNEKLALGNAIKCPSLDILLKEVDVVTLHVNGDPINKKFFGEKEFSQMRPGSYFLNLSRGFVVDEESLAQHIDSGKIRGAAIDVFHNEPKANGEGFTSPLINKRNVILSPHIGGSTTEAQENIAEFVSDLLINYFNEGNTHLSVNYPDIKLAKIINAYRFIHVHKNRPGILAQINGILSEYDINVLGQYLKTKDDLGYVVTDVSSELSREVIEDIKSIPFTISIRILS
jgi:D-3-phosphoglycerate dehydrogenase